MKIVFLNLKGLVSRKAQYVSKAAACELCYFFIFDIESKTPVFDAVSRGRLVFKNNQRKLKILNLASFWLIFNVE